VKWTFLVKTCLGQLTIDCCPTPCRAYHTWWTGTRNRGGGQGGQFPPYLSRVRGKHCCLPPPHLLYTRHGGGPSIVALLDLSLPLNRAARVDFAGSEEDVQEAFAAFPDVDSSQLHHQLRLLKTLFKDSDNSTVTTTTMAKTLLLLPPITQDLFKDTLIHHARH